MATTPVCPHCGFEIEDEEICRACGALLEDIPIRDVSLTRDIGRFFAGLKDKGFHGALHQLALETRGRLLFSLMKEIKKLHE